MALPKEQIEQIKKQLIEQIESTFPEEKKIEAKQQIESMDEKQLEEFLINNNLIKQEGQKCIFCSIISGENPSYKIGENKNAIAILEINPISKGHTIIIPKLHVQEISNETKDFAKKISLKLKKKLSAKDIQITDFELFGHKVLNLIPIYNDDTLKNKRQKASKEELEKLQIELEKEPEIIKEKPVEKVKEEQITEKNTWLPKRIP